MLKITIKTGPHAGESRLVSHILVDPVALLSVAVGHGWHWEIDYPSATLEEMYFFLRADIVCRALLAKKEGRPVFLKVRNFPTFRNGRTQLLHLDQWEFLLIEMIRQVFGSRPSARKIERRVFKKTG